MRKRACLAAASGLLAASPAAALDLADPAPLIAMFRDTCLADFPQTEVIARKALNAGWVEREVRLTAGRAPNGIRAANLPRFFESRGVRLILATNDGSGTLVTSCRVATSGTRELTVDRLAAAAAAALQLGPATRDPKSRGSAAWLRADGTKIQASADKIGASRSLTVLIRQ